MTIYFNSRSGEFAYLSNFSPHGFTQDGGYWPTVEHYFQAAKFFETDGRWAEQIRHAATPAIAKSMGRSRKHPIRKDWEEAKVEVMRFAVLRKFETHSGLQEKLLDTADEPLVEDAPNDRYWGSGRDGSGQNVLGRILMEVRAVLTDRQGSS